MDEKIRLYLLPLGNATEAEGMYLEYFLDDDEVWLYQPLGGGDRRPLGLVGARQLEFFLSKIALAQQQQEKASRG